MATSTDIEYLKQQRRFHRLRWLGLERTSAEERSRPSCIMIQIDGLSHEAFRKALRGGKMPFVARLIDEGKLKLGPWVSMLPTSTSAFQTGLFYGNNDDIPGFFWFDKKLGRMIKMNSTEDTARIEAAVRERVSPYSGLLANGSAYSALFTGGAANSFLTFARLFSPQYNLSSRRPWILLFLLSQIMLIWRIFYYSTVEVILGFYDLFRGIFTVKNKYLEFKFLFPRILSVVVLREFATLATILDIYRGVGPVYLNNIAYDEHAHHRGPDSAFAFWTLKGVDGAIKRIWHAAEIAKRLHIRRYDVYIWSDHGQTPTTPFQEQHQQIPERHFDLQFRSQYGDTPEQRAEAEELKVGERVAKRRVVRGPRVRYEPRRHLFSLEHARQLTEAWPRWLRFVITTLLRPVRNIEQTLEKMLPADAHRRIRLVSTGPVGHLCLLDRQEPTTFEDWSAEFPRFLEIIAHHPGIGLAIIRTRDGEAMVGAQRRWVDLRDETGLREMLPTGVAETLRERREEIRRWINMPSAGDIMLLGHRDNRELVVTYSYEYGGHAGISALETIPFILVPREVTEDWPELNRELNDHPLTLMKLHARLRALYGKPDEST